MTKGILETVNEKLDKVLAVLGTEVKVEVASKAAVNEKPAEDFDDNAWGDDAEPAEKVAAPAEVASRNRWIELVDGSVVMVKKGEELPDAAEIAKNSTKAAYDAYVAEAAGGDDADASFDEGWDEGEDAAAEQAVKEAIPFDKFEGIVKLFGSNGNGERAKQLMAKHSADGKTANIKQYAENIEGRNAILETLKANWKAYAKAAERVKFEG